jgi:hypothetical protein
LAHLREAGPTPQVEAPKSGRNLEKFRSALVWRSEAEPEGLSTGWLRITPAPSQTSPICERIIKGPAAGTPDPVRGHPRPRTARPPTKRTIRPPTARNPSAVPLARGTGYSTPVAVPTIGHWMIARTVAVPHSLDASRPIHLGSPHVRSRWTGLDRYRSSYTGFR